jgi:hypothetical protein
MTFMSLMAGDSLLLYRRRNEDIFEKLKADPVEKKTAQYKEQLLNPIIGMEDVRYLYKSLIIDLQDDLDDH